MANRFIKIKILFFLLCFSVHHGKSQSIGGSISGSIIYCDTSNSGFLSLNGYNGTILDWESSTDSISWASTSNNITLQSYYHLLQTTWYRAIVQDMALTPDTSTTAKVIVHPASKGGTVTGGGVFCGGTGAGTLTLSGNVGAVVNWQHSINNGLSWIVDANTTNSLNYLNISQNTLYEAVVQTDIACAMDTSSQVSFVFSASVAGTLSAGGIFCANSGTGTLHLSGYTGTIVNWQYSTDGGSIWTSVANITDSLAYTNITQNTLYEAVVQLNACPSDSSNQASFVFTPSVAGTLSTGDTVCFGTNGGALQLTGNTGSVVNWLSSTNSGALWSPVVNATTTLTYTNLTQTTWYKTVVKNNTCMNDTTVYVNINILPLPLVNAGNDTAIYLGETVKLNASGGGTAVWLPANILDTATIYTPLAIPETSTLFVLTVTDTNMCVNSDSVFVTVNVKQFNGAVANILTPDGDGINDSWYIQDIQKYSGNEVSVYNIYGNLVYSKKEYTNDWMGTYNGAALPDGTYYYVLRFDSAGKTIKGSLDILRK